MPKRPTTCVCGTKFLKEGLKPYHPYCSPTCKLKHVSGNAKHEDLSKLSRSVLWQMARGEFQKWIKKRDLGKPCITTGEPFKKGDPIHAGHLFKVELYPGLAFDEDNCFAQSAQANFSMDDPKVIEQTGKNTMLRIGLSKYEKLVKKSDNVFYRNYKHSSIELIEIIQKYRELNKAN